MCSDLLHGQGLLIAVVALLGLAWWQWPAIEKWIEAHLPGVDVPTVLSPGEVLGEAQSLAGRLLGEASATRLGPLTDMDVFVLLRDRLLDRGLSIEEVQSLLDPIAPKIFYPPPVAHAADDATKSAAEKTTKAAVEQLMAGVLAELQARASAVAAPAVAVKGGA